MSELKPCPFCGGAAEHEHEDVYGDPDSRRDMCTDCSASAPTTIWNTRAAPTMKAWEWVAVNGGACLTCDKRKSHVQRNRHGWWASQNGGQVIMNGDKPKYFATDREAMDACFNAVEKELKEWLV